MTQTARQTAIVKQDDSIQANVAAIQAKRPNALEVMAARLNITSQSLSKTLRGTVFAKANDDEFAALVIVANEYKLNPLTKEIYAFPAKGGGIVPIVSIDGWIRIANEHPMMDGFEQTNIADDQGKLLGTETSIWRKDRSRPIRITAYLDECQENTDPWRKKPARMLGHKSFIQCARYAFGFSGIYDEDEAKNIGDIRLVAESSPPPMRSTAPALTNDSEDEEEIARQLDSGFDPRTGEVMIGRADHEHGDQFDGTDEAPAWKASVDDWTSRANAAEHMAEINVIQKQYDLSRAVLPDDVVAELDDVLSAARKRIGGAA